MATMVFVCLALLTSPGVQPPFVALYRPYVIAAAVIAAAQFALTVGLRLHRVRRRTRAESFRDADPSGRFEERTAILRAMPDPMFVLRWDGTYLDYYARDPKLLFRPPDQFLGRKVRDVMPAGAADLFMDALTRACLGNGEPVVVEYELVMNEPRHFEARLVHAGRNRVVSIVRDVTDAKRALTLNRELAGRLISSQEEERSRIARDLHDDVSQEIAAIGVDVSYVRQHVPCPDAQDRLLSLGQRIATLAESLRLLSHGLHPTVLNHIGLVAALQAHCAEVERKHHLHVRLFADEALEPCSPLVALSLFRIGQEALQNTTKHGHAREASVSLARDDHHIMFSISDDGAGFDVAAARQNGGLGLVSLEERARLIHGDLTIRSAPGCGTTIDVTVPTAVIDQDEEWSDQCVVQPYCSPTIMSRSRMASSES